MFKEAIQMHITNITEAKAQFSALIEKVLNGEEIVIGKAGKPVAKIVRYERSMENFTIITRDRLFAKYQVPTISA